MTETEDRPLAQVLAQTVSELRVLRRELATATGGLPVASRAEPRSERSQPSRDATVSPNPERPLPETHAVASRVNTMRFGMEAVQKPPKPLAPRSPSGAAVEPRGYAWEAVVKSLAATPKS